MRVAIAGSRSLLAQALKKICVGAGWEVALIGRDANAASHFDALDQSAALPRLERIDSLVICAASFGATTLQGTRENIQVNVLGTLALLESAVRDKVGHIVYVSSTSAVAARDSYGLSKAMAEAVLRQLCSPSGIKLAILRPAQIYDTQGHATKHQPFLYFLIDQLSDQRDVRLYGSKDVARNYVHVDDVAQALFCCVRDRLEGVFNGAHPRSLTVSEIAEVIRREFGASGKITFDPGKPDMPEIAIPQEDSIFEQVSGLTPRAFADGIRAIRAYRAEQGGKAI